MSKHYCSVPGCVESGESHPVLHVFPNPSKYPDRFRSWVLAVGGDILGLHEQYIYANRRVCHRHFEEKHCCRNNRLSQLTVPRKNLPGLSVIPQFSFGGQRHLRPIQNIGQHMPSTSKDKYAIFGPEFDSEHQHFQQSSAIENKENEPERAKENLFHIKTSQAEICTNDPPINVQCPVEKMDVTEHRTSVTTQRNPHAQAIAATCNPTKEVPKPARAVCGMKTKRKGIPMTKQEETLYKKLRSLQIKLSRCRNKQKNYLKKVKMAQNIMTNQSFVSTLENMTNAGKILTLLQFREQKKKGKGRRFTNNEKILCLSLYKQSPKAYRFLRKILLLPASQTLDKLVKRTVITPGINQKVFEQLKSKAQKMKAEHKLCVLLFDEVALQANITYSDNNDKINGLVVEGGDIKFANHALVFMLRGLIKNFKQPIAYTFCSGATKATDLKKYITEIIKEVTKAGFTVVATVCDQGSNNEKAIKSLIDETRTKKLRNGEEHRRNTFDVDKSEIIPLYDPPHLLKGIRNNLLFKALRYTNEDGKVCMAKWEHIQMLYSKNPEYKGIRLMPKLTEQHVDIAKMAKMKVKFASQIFSQNVAFSLGFLADNGLLPLECKDTADVCKLFDELFDSMNGSYGKKGIHAKRYLSQLTPNSPHHKLWSRAKKLLKTMEFVTPDNKTKKVPTLKNYLWTIEGLEYLIKKMSVQYKVRSIWTRHLNQDPLENFFGSIRSHGCRNNNPSPAAFQSSFTALMINNLTSVHAAGANCEEDFCESLQAFLIFPTVNKDNHVQDLIFDHIIMNPTPLEEKKKTSD